MKNPLFFLALASLSVGGGLAASSADIWAAEPASSEWSHHFQITVISQTHGAFSSPVQGPLSLKPSFEDPTSLTSTLFIGHRLWKDASIFVNPEESAGAGLSQTHGIAAFPNGEIYRVDDPSTKINLSRLFYRQYFGFGGGTESLEDEANQFADTVDRQRLTVVGGKFSLNDFLDDNAYSHDPRTQFFNWALMDNAAWDYAADTRGYTWGVYLDYHSPLWSLRIASVEVPASANGLEMDGDIIHARGDNAELEYRYALNGHPGKARLLGYMNHANMGNYRDAITQAAAAGVTPDVTTTRSYRTKYGWGLGVEQELTADLGVFARLGWNDGATETWAFTEVDRSFSVGASLKGSRWSRVDDTVGLALMIDGLSKDHADYLSAGGLGFLVGDGPAAGSSAAGPYMAYAPEYVIEAYYSAKLIRAVSFTADFQYVNNPGYNSLRGPVPIFAGRLHAEF